MILLLLIRKSGGKKASKKIKVALEHTTTADIILQFENYVTRTENTSFFPFPKQTGNTTTKKRREINNENAAGFFFLDEVPKCAITTAK